MPTIRQNISYAYKRSVKPYRASIAHIVRSVAVLFLAALLLEVFVFNYNYFATLSNKPINLKDQIELAKGDDGLFRLTAVDHVMEFKNLNTEVRNIRIDFDEHQPAQNLRVKVQFTDDAHHTYFDSTEYTVGVPEVDVSTYVTESEYINLNTAGYVNNLRIEVVGDEVTYPIKLWTVSLNAHCPFTFSGARFTAAFGLLLLCFMFRPRSSIYRINIVENPRRSKAGVIGMVAVEMALVSSLLFFGSNLVGVATSSYNFGSWDGTSVVNTFEVGGDNAQQYAELARAMAKGQLYLDEEPPQWLQDMPDPYDKGARDEAQKETGEAYLFDVAYYEGHYYVYFGVVPVLLFYLPFYLVTGANFPTAIGVLIAALAFILGCSALLDRFARYHFKRVSLGLYLLLQIPLVFCCGILYLVKFPTFYSLPIMCGLAFSVWGLYCWMRGRLSKHACAWYLAGSLCMALVAGCRPQLLALSLLAFPLFWRTYITKRRLLTPAGAREFACLVAPYVVVAAGIMGYNYARFGSLTDFGANYNLTVNDMTKRGMNVGRLAPAFFAYFLQPPNVTGTFPFIQAVDFSTTYMGQTIKEVTFGGIFACLPVLWILPFARRILDLRRRARSTRTIMGVIVVLLASGVLVALLDAEMAGILQRYYADFSFMFLAAVVLLAFIVNENMAAGSTAHVIGMKVLLVLVALSVLYSALLCFVPETGWYSDIYPWAYQDIIETAQFWT
ncbi:cytochrome C oxidase Cbb3 [Adlercreutzia sp. ZJ473]|uniref:cytochrome C oxidase Cbb3 n=1 Tax=Adlercreutzia sp. ZJ473 TaxID=2722822 RepID=UPI0015577687|nr:cytochrome C oxidase Cbb3 [Adlercreutzia sp. ZJ473]